MTRPVLVLLAVLLISLPIIFITASASSETSVYVDSSYTGTSKGTVNKPFKTIGDAIAAGDEIHIANGTYAEDLFLVDKVLIGAGSVEIEGQVRTSGNCLISNVVIGEVDPHYLIVDLDGDGSGTPATSPWTNELGSSSTLVSEEDAVLMDMGPYEVIVLVGLDIQPEFETTAVDHVEKGGSLIIDGPVLAKENSHGIQVLAGMVQTRWVGSPGVPGGVVSIEDGWDANLTAATGSVHYLEGHGTTLAMVYVLGEWRPFIMTNGQTTVGIAMELYKLDPAGQSSAVETIAGALPSHEVVAVNGALDVVDCDLSGSIHAIDSKATLLDTSFDDGFTTNGMITSYSTLDISTRDHEGRPLSDIDVLIQQDGKAVYSTEHFGGSDPRPSGGRMSIKLLSGQLDHSGWNWQSTTLTTESNWNHTEVLDMRTPFSRELNSPNPDPRTIGFTYEFMEDGIEALWEKARDPDLDGYRLEISGPESLLYEISMNRTSKALDILDGETYTASLTVIDVNGLESIPYRTVVHTPNKAPSSPLNVRAVGESVSSMNVTWEPARDHDIANHIVVYSDHAGHLDPSRIDPPGTLSVVTTSTSTVATVSDLIGGRLYHFSVFSVDSHGAFTASEVISKVMPNDPPTIAITHPLDSRPVTDRVVIEGFAVDHDFVGIVEYRVDDGNWTRGHGAERWSVVMDATKLDGGDHTVSVRISDGSESSTDSLSLKVQAEEDTARPSSGISPGALVAVGILSFLLTLIISEAGVYIILSSLMPLYARVTGKTVLNNYVRGKIHGYIIANPGNHYSEIMRTLGLTNGVFAYHVKVLEREKMVKSQMDGRKRRFYPVGMRVEPPEELDSLQVRILNVIAENPGISQKELSEVLSVRKQVINVNVRTMFREGVIDIVKEGRETHCYLLDAEDGDDSY